MANTVSWLGSRIKQDENNRLVTDVQIAKWDNVEIPEAIKNPNALSIQLNGGTATEYDGSAAKSIDITPASIGAATSGDLANYIPLTGTEALEGNLIPAENKHPRIGKPDKPFSEISCNQLWIRKTDGSTGRIQITNDLGIVFNSKNGEEGYGYFEAPDKITAGTTWRLPNKSDTLATIHDIPTSLPASDVKDWAKADTKPTYTFAEITEKPDTYTPSEHNHKIADVTGLEDTLGTKVNRNPTFIADWNDAKFASYYFSAAGATNAPEETLGYFGQVCKSSTTIMQVLYPEGASGGLISPDAPSG